MTTIENRAEAGETSPHGSIHDLDELEQKLVMASIEAKNKAYCPYSKFRVGAAVLTNSGDIIKGCNVENAAFPLCVCAERNAINTAVQNGHRKFTSIAICCDVAGSFKGPCGACRQSIVEFGKDWKVILVKPDLTIYSTTIQQLLPLSFGPHDLEEERIKY